jgi:hypothetical protein
LPLYGVFKQQVWRSDEGAINAYLNRYFISRLPDIDEAVIADVVRCVGRGQSRPVVTLFGYAPIEGTLIGSAAFGVECLLLTIVAHLRRELSVDCLIVYVPHPVHAATAFDQPAFIDSDVKICPDSTVAWLISDVCMALASSAMFEGAYFGARGFTPMLTEDRVFTADYLAQLTAPTAPSVDALKLALRELLAGYQRPSSTAVVDRARQRLHMMRADGRLAAAQSALA